MGRFEDEKDLPVDPKVEADYLKMKKEKNYLDRKWKAKGRTPEQIKKSFARKRAQEAVYLYWRLKIGPFHFGTLAQSLEDTPCTFINDNGMLEVDEDAINSL